MASPASHTRRSLGSASRAILSLCQMPIALSGRCASNFLVRMLVGGECSRCRACRRRRGRPHAGRRCRLCTRIRRGCCRVQGKAAQRRLPLAVPQQAAPAAAVVADSEVRTRRRISISPTTATETAAESPEVGWNSQNFCLLAAPNSNTVEGPSLRRSFAPSETIGSTAPILTSA
jgi:hypothetical protein